jgi:hypothetical protein
MPAIDMSKPMEQSIPTEAFSENTSTGTGAKKWTRGDRIALISLIVGIIAAIAGVLAVPGLLH